MTVLLLAKYVLSLEAENFHHFCQENADDKKASENWTISFMIQNACLTTLDDILSRRTTTKSSPSKPCTSNHAMAIKYDIICHAWS